MAKPFDLAPTLAALRDRQRYRRRRLLASAQQPLALVDGREVVNFCSNDYLGLAADPRVTDAFVRAAQAFGVGSGASHLVIGHHVLHEQLEEALADFVGAERVLTFTSGYAANLGVISALTGRRDVVLQDKWNHASLLDGGQLGAATSLRYAHADPGALRERLAAVQDDQHCLVVTDGVFSMDGDIAPLPLLAEACQQHQAWLMVDDAHGFGVLGPHGEGSLHHFDFAGDGGGRNTAPHHPATASSGPAATSKVHADVYMATLGKALGVGGAFVAGDEALIEFLIQKARTYIYTTALPPAMAAATLASLAIVREEDWRRTHLAALIARFRAGVSRMGLPLLDSTTAIQPIVLGDDGAAVDASARLLARGFLVSAIRPPTVPEGTARLRVTLTAAHTETQVDDLLDALNDLPVMPPVA